MANVVTAMTTSITPASLYGVIADVVPFLAVIIPVALGYYLFRKLAKGSGKAKVRV